MYSTATWSLMCYEATHQWDTTGGCVTGRKIDQTIGSLRGDEYIFPSKLALYVVAKFTQRAVSQPPIAG